LEVDRSTPGGVVVVVVVVVVTDFFLEELRGEEDGARPQGRAAAGRRTARLLLRVTVEEHDG